MRKQAFNENGEPRRRLALWDRTVTRAVLADKRHSVWRRPHDVPRSATGQIVWIADDRSDICEALGTATLTLSRRRVRGKGWPWATTLALGVCFAAVGCVNDTRDLHAQRTEPKRWTSRLGAQSWGLCSLIGPGQRNPGVWGSDLGFTVHVPGDQRLAILFGDTWTSPVQGCQYPGWSDNDLQGTLPLERPARFKPGPPAPQLGAQPGARNGSDCELLEYATEQPNDARSWRRVRLFPSAAAHRAQDAMGMSVLRTPLSAWSDGERLLGLFARYESAPCTTQGDCPSGMQCSKDPNYHGIPVRECSPLIHLSDHVAPGYCLENDDCANTSTCDLAREGVCLADAPFTVDTPHGRVSPSWYRDDPRRGIARIIYVASAIWPERPADYATIARFATNRFQNPTARTVAYFDPKHPESADYRPGYHTLFIWGRNGFVESGGAQALPFLLYVPLDELRGPPGQSVWRPRFFAGYDADGLPAWSERESDARPIYGGRLARLQPDTDKLEFAEPEFDQVAQMTLSWVAPLSRWVMFYGGDLPAFLVLEARTGDVRSPVHKQWAPGAIHMRTSPHPWGAARIAPQAVPAQPSAASAMSEDVGWSSAEPILTREQAAPYLACASGTVDMPKGCVRRPAEFRAFELVQALARATTQPWSDGWKSVAKSCIAGEISRKVQDRMSGNMIGRLYAPNIIDEWTHDVTDAAARARGERSVELYWNVSTWNPYQVVLWKTLLTLGVDASAASAGRPKHR
jgi:hypothetical protein